jgi:hypothetical protein
MVDKTKIKGGAVTAAPRIVLIGVEGGGKTTAGAQCEAPIFLSAEDGLVGKGYENIPHYSPETWEGVLEFLTYIHDENHGYKSLIIDTIDWLEPLLFAYICTRDKKSGIEDYGYGKGYVVAVDEFRKALAILDAIHRNGILVMINAHCQIKVFNNPIGDNYDRYEPKTTKQIAGIIKEWADVVLFANYETLTAKEKGSSKAKGVGGQTRIVHTQHSAAWDAKNRYGLPAVMPLDMPTILEAMTVGNPDSTVNIIAEINNLLPLLEPEKQQATVDYVAKNGCNALKLSQMLNKIRTLTQDKEAA